MLSTITFPNIDRVSSLMCCFTCSQSSRSESTAAISLASKLIRSPIYVLVLIQAIRHTVRVVYINPSGLRSILHPPLSFVKYIFSCLHKHTYIDNQLTIIITSPFLLLRHSRIKGVHNLSMKASTSARVMSLKSVVSLRIVNDI